MNYLNNCKYSCILVRRKGDISFMLPKHMFARKKICYNHTRLWDL